MSIFGSVILTEQLNQMGVKNLHYYTDDSNAVKDKLLSLLFQIYSKNGDAIAN